MRRLAVLLAAALGLAACEVGPTYRAPELSPAAAFRNTAEPRSDTPRSADWWRAFADPALDRLEQAALAQNLDIAASVARVKSARAAAGSAEAALAPSGELDGQAARARQSLVGQNALAAYVPNYPRTGSLFDATIGAAWELDLFGGVRRQTEAARAEAEGADAELTGARLMVASDVADAYLQLRGDQRRLALAERQTEIDAHLADLVALRFAAGEAPRRDLDEAQASLAAARAAQPLLRAGVESELNRLAVLTGRSPEAERGDLASDAPIPAAPAFEAGTPAAMLQRRPDLIAAQRRLVAANARVGAAIAEYYPTISLQGLVGFESTRTGVLLTGAAQEAQGAAGLKWRLFDFKRIDADVANARGVRAQALAAYRMAALRAAEDVEDALSLRLQRQAQARELHASEVALERARQAAADAYAAGALSLLEVIDADRALLQTEDQAAEADAETARASVALVRALGGGEATEVR